MSIHDTRAITRIDRERYMTALNGQLDAAWKAALALPEGHHRREPALDAIQAAWETNQALISLFQEAEAAMAGAYAAIDTVTEQRDEIAAEYERLMEAIQNFWFTEHPALETFTDTILENHNEAFWSSLPYDMAQALGEQWTHMDADMLYTLITVELELFDDHGIEYGVTCEQVRLFRAALLVMLRQLREANGG